MIPNEQRILGLNATLFREAPTPVYILSDGRFAAMHGGDWVVRKTLQTLQKAVAKRITEFLTIFANNGEFKPVDASEFLASKIIDREGKRHHKGWSEWYVYDAAAAAKLKDIADRREKGEKLFDAERREVLEKLQRVHASNFKDLLNGIKDEEAEE